MVSFFDVTNRLLGKYKIDDSNFVHFVDKIKVSFEILPPLYHQLKETSTFLLSGEHVFLCMFVFASSNRSKTGF